MDLEASRSKQRAAQQQAHTQPDGVARIGDRDPLTGLYTVQFPDGGIGANGIKTYTAASKPGDIVVLFPRADGSIAIDSEKGNPSIVPDVFNKPVPDVKKGGVWIFYRSAGKLWIGGHQLAPEEIGTASDPNYRISGYHVWGDKNGWIATYQSASISQASKTMVVTLHCELNEGGSRGQNNITKGLGPDSFRFYFNDPGWIPPHSTFPLGGGFVAFRSSIETTPVASGRIGSVFTYSGSATLSIGYLKLGVSAVEVFEMSHTGKYTEVDYPNPPTLNPDIEQKTVTFEGNTRIPNVGICQYKGIYNAKENRPKPGQPTLDPEYSIQSVITYAIMCDRGATYYIRETVSASGVIVISPATQRKYELFSSDSAQVISTNLSEPRFFGIRWDLRSFDIRSDVYPSDNASLVSFFYGDPRYYHPFIAGLAQFSLYDTNGSRTVAYYHGSFPVGYYRRSRVQPIGAPALIPVYDYDGGAPVTYSGGSIVKIPATEILKSTIGPGFLVRKTVAIDGTESTIKSAYCHAIPADAVILHWSTTADEH